MTEPQDSNDDWAELAREFALDKPSAPIRDDVSEEPVGAAVPETSESAPEEGESEDDFEEGEEAAPGDGEPGSEGTGTGRKRRRRRRRRRKGGDVANPALVRDEGEEAEAPDEVAEPEPVAEADEVGAPERDDREEAEDFDSEPAPMTAEEDTANDVLRELIATWNVPSWDSIVSGLYRPN